jgi:tetratricopeptide (TPR) repeat protein
MNATPHGVMNVDRLSKGGRVFVSYRRSDSSGYVGRVRKELAKKFNLFRDLEDIAPGDDVSAAIRNSLSTSSVLLVIVGPEWLRARDEDGQMRLSNPQDYVRLEVLTAMERGLRVIPVLVGGSRMPSSRELPDGLHGFANFNALELSDMRWEYDLKKLVAVVRPIVDPWFRFRQVCLALVAIAVLTGGTVAISHITEGRRIEQALKIAREGKVDEALETLKNLEDKKAPENVNPRIYLYEAQVYQIKGDVLHQNAAAEQAAKQAGGKNNFIAGRAKVLACDAKGAEKNFDEALRDCEQAREYATRANDAEGQVRAINTKGNVLRAAQKPNESLKAYQDAVDYAQRHDLLIDWYGALNDMGLVFQDQGQLDKAKDKYETARKGFQDLGERGEASNACNNLGTLSQIRGEIEKALDYFQQALVLANKAGDKSREAQAHLSLGTLSEQTGLLRQAEMDLKAALQIYEGLGREIDIAFVNNSLGDIYLQQAKYEDAKKVYTDAASLVNLDLQQGGATPVSLLGHIETAVQEAVDAGDSESESFARVIKARVLLQLNRTVEATQEAARALDLAIKGKQPDNEVAARIVLAEIKGMNKPIDETIKELDELADFTHHPNVGENLEAGLTSLKVMLRGGSAKQRSDARVLLGAFQITAQEKGYMLLVAKAQAILAGNAQSLTKPK